MQGQRSYMYSYGSLTRQNALASRHDVTAALHSRCGNGWVTKATNRDSLTTIACIIQSHSPLPAFGAQHNAVLGAG
jgi:hypothetical protein